MWIDQLSKAADDFLPLQPLVEDTLSTKCWDSLPLALNLREASRGLPSRPRWCISNSDLLSKLHEEDLKGKPVQNLVYKELVSAKLECTLNDTFERRLADLFHPYDLDFSSSIFLQRCCDILKKNWVADSVKVIKGWCVGAPP